MERHKFYRCGRQTTPQQSEYIAGRKLTAVRTPGTSWVSRKVKMDEPSEGRISWTTANSGLKIALETLHSPWHCTARAEKYVYIELGTFLYSDLISTSYRRKIKTDQLFNTNFATKWSSLIEANLVEAYLKTLLRGTIVNRTKYC